MQRSPDAISRRAFEIWEREGRPDGCDLRHWLEAEQELNAERSGSANGTSENSSREDTASPVANSDVQPLKGTRAAAGAGRSKRSSSSRKGAA